MRALPHKRLVGIRLKPRFLRASDVNGQFHFGWFLLELQAQDLEHSPPHHTELGNWGLQCVAKWTSLDTSGWPGLTCPIPRPVSCCALLGPPLHTCSVPTRQGRQLAVLPFLGHLSGTMAGHCVWLWGEVHVQGSSAPALG